MKKKTIPVDIGKFHCTTIVSGRYDSRASKNFIGVLGYECSGLAPSDKPGEKWDWIPEFRNKVFINVVPPRDFQYEIFREYIKGKNTRRGTRHCEIRSRRIEPLRDDYYDLICRK
jgi:hypothetical protein